MNEHPSKPAAAIAEAVSSYKNDGDVPRLLSRLRAATQGAAPASLIEAVEPFKDIPEVAGPVYEVIVAQQPDDARSLVILANSYWLAGRGPDVVGDLASRAISADPANRGGWHLWAITGQTSRERVTRWQQVSGRFPQDDLAKAALADNAASLASSDDDPVALKLAISTYEDLLARAQSTPQKLALENALRTLKGE